MFFIIILPNLQFDHLRDPAKAENEFQTAKIARNERTYTKHKSHCSLKLLSITAFMIDQDE